jgi:hypothetical protein
MLLVTLHGGKPGTHPHRNNVHAYDSDGKLISPSVLEDTDGIVLDELRAIRLFGKFLYVVNANRTQNSVFCYAGSGTNYRLAGTFVSPSTCKAVLHPFDLTFDGTGHCYLSSQDTNVVTRLTLSADCKAGQPAPLPAGLPGGGTFLPGTFVASNTANLCGMTTTAVPLPAGLSYTAEGQKKHSVRGVAWANDALYVVDQPAGRVKVYDTNGKLVGRSNKVETPVHLTVHGGDLYVTGANNVLQTKLPTPPGDFSLSVVPGVHVKNASGMAFSDKGHIYIASRTENRIFKFDADFRPMDFQCELPDNPEFIVHV